MLQAQRNSPQDKARSQKMVRDMESRRGMAAAMAKFVDNISIIPNALSKFYLLQPSFTLTLGDETLTVVGLPHLLNKDAEGKIVMWGPEFNSARFGQNLTDIQNKIRDIIEKAKNPEITPELRFMSDGLVERIVKESIIVVATMINMAKANGQVGLVKDAVKFIIKLLNRTKSLTPIFLSSIFAMTPEILNEPQFYDFMGAMFSDVSSVSGVAAKQKKQNQTKVKQLQQKIAQIKSTVSTIQQADSRRVQDAMSDVTNKLYEFENRLQQIARQAASRPQTVQMPPMVQPYDDTLLVNRLESIQNNQKDFTDVVSDLSQRLDKAKQEARTAKQSYQAAQSKLQLQTAKAIANKQSLAQKQNMIEQILTQVRSKASAVQRAEKLLKDLTKYSAELNEYDEDLTERQKKVYQAEKRTRRMIAQTGQGPSMKMVPKSRRQMPNGRWGAYFKGPDGKKMFRFCKAPRK